MYGPWEDLVEWLQQIPGTTSKISVQKIAVLGLSAAVKKLDTAWDPQVLDLW